jgi:HD superfamily phosphohydrolase
MLPGKSRTYHDPLHGAITLNGDDPVEALLIRLIDTPEFQRLRRIRQLDTAFLTFHGAEGSRFTHSLGAMELTRKAFDAIASKYPLLQPHRSAVLVAALLHDVGHGPFSHAGEEIFNNHHELWTIKLIHQSRLTAILKGFDPNLPYALEKVFNKTYTLPIVHQLVSSQLDCDRLDYLQRDGYFTGARYGQLDLDRILSALSYDPITQRLVVNKKGVVAIEHYLTVRYFMYLQVYNHPKNIAARFILEQVFRRAANLLSTQHLEIDPVVKAWLLQNPNQLSSDTYLAADDIVFGYHLHRWRSSGDHILMDMCRRYLDRDLFRTIDISDKTPAEQTELLNQVKTKLIQQGFDPEYYCGIRVARTRGYTLYQQGIEIQTQQGLKDISSLSPLVTTLSKPIEKTLLLYPKRTIEATNLNLI